MSKIRVEKYISDILEYSRSDIKKLISKKRLKVNEKIVEKGYKIDPYLDKVYIDNKEIKYEKFRYYMFNKPSGFVCANKDDNEAVVFDILNLNKDKYFTFGRLDKDTEGLLIISNDGQMSHKLLSPKNHVPKKYFVKTDKPFPNELINFKDSFIFSDGTKIDKYKFEFIDNKSCYLTIYEGKFHQIKKMMGVFNLGVIYLKRVMFGKLSLDPNLKLGEIRQLSEEEIKLMQEQN
ncbi:16S rRNA pseudouridine synthase [Mycoplasmopsis maculosa]|uniref:16S rRNA pseudouridine synthase n=1 Tax=Mycoplasmopsis maculosa TaxID=114885 RepID=A0A449B3F9_9BACT|nr:pseudouridine synthase [Mycoplasmopsis maculosa]VEU75099.1 16S rRNA pseudouridine synthase [Mycoplasmopsis maculosa]